MMHFRGNQKIKASRERVWEFLTDPRLVSRCAPGLERLETPDDRRFRALGKVAFGPIKGSFTVEGIWVERVAPERARLRARGKIPGNTVETEVRVTLSTHKETATAVRWEADVKLKGLLALTGGRGLQPVADAAANAFFRCVRRNLKASAAQTAPAAGRPG
jgi:carbon monoxide dehydrogenase subunit G